MLINLTNNATKFTPEDELVGIRTCRSPDGEIHLEVWDRGIGIPNEEIERVRQPFYQFESTFQKKYAGAGLGLSICDALVRLHGGRIEIESEVSKGTTVTAVLPGSVDLSALGGETEGLPESQPCSA